ncbi:hypothetical protein LUZ62_069167 [Rhynchospora pubera]|uniref:DUF547 domain-containing protein n=1 Tax=Rhynchospora pubera TaxID=906938 RepID=A0AAV8CX86_9POAL|nr:hypothetical protein LUZ62_069167 [Rhynchospora pubera]
MNRMDTPRANWDCKYIKERHSHSISAVQEDILNISPRLSYYNPTISLERKLHRRNSLNIPKDTTVPSRISASSVPSTEDNTPRSVADLVSEIATLELEVVHLERHLLTLYRTAFDQYISSSPTTVSRALTSHASFDQPKLQTILCSHKSHDKLPKPFKTAGGNVDSASTPIYISDRTDCDEATISHPRNSLQNSTSGHRSLADHFGSSIVDHVTEISPHRLSEEIIRCISAVYCKLAKPTRKSEDSDISFSSCTPSVSSSSSSYSPTEPCDFSSSQSCFESPKHKNLLYDNAIVVPHIRIDAHRFGYASKMLQNFRSLIRRLEKIDPREMNHDEQLSFWINIHNALVMHAYLAYGLQKNRMRSTHMILKAAYNVGGHSVNACTIQGSILGCEPHRPALWMLALFASTKRTTTVSQRHVYAIDRPEPLAHFALCTGAISDPPVRLYTAKQIYKELHSAKTEFILANVLVKKQNKILLPRMLYYYGKDASFELRDILEMICKCLPESQQRKDMERLCLKKKIEKYVEWLPYKSSFKYVVHRGLAQQ